MKEPLAYLNGVFVSARQASIGLDDSGFVLGTTVAERLRTFAGRLFRLAEHLDRLRHSLEIVGLSIPESWDELSAAAEKLVAHNRPFIPPDGDLGLAMFVTPGPLASAGSEQTSARPTVGLHTFALPFQLWAAKYTSGAVLRTSAIRQVPMECWPPELKCRSRMHYYLADREVHQREPGSQALLLDAHGQVMETSQANLLIYTKRDGIISPPKDRILPGISLAVVAELASSLGIPLGERQLSTQDVASADEVWLSSTSPCLLSVVRFDGQPIGQGKPGPVYHQILSAWSRLVGIDIPRQARKLAGLEGGA